MVQNKSLNTSQKKLILLEFTKELIKHSAEGEVFELKKILKNESKEQELPKEENLIEGMEKSRISSEEESRQDIIPRVRERIKPVSKPLIKKGPLSPLIIPKSRLPPRFQYLKPTPTNLEIDLGKLNPLIKDPLVRDIECSGANQNIIVTGMMGRKKTDITLTREEIEKIVKKFSETARIPMLEGVFRVVVGKLIFSAVISSLIGSKFVIKKMIYNPGYR